MRAEDDPLPPGHNRQKWEYHQCTWNPGDKLTLTDALDKLGEKGWEAYSVVVAPSGAWLAFVKRPKP